MVGRLGTCTANGLKLIYRFFYKTMYRISGMIQGSPWPPGSVSLDWSMPNGIAAL